MSEFTRKLRITHKIVRDSVRAIAKVWNPDADTVARDKARFSLDASKRDAEVAELESTYDFNKYRQLRAEFKAKQA